MEALDALTHPDAEFHSVFAESEGRTYYGREGLRQYLGDLEEAFESFGRELGTVELVGDDTIVGETRIHAVGRGSGVEIDQTMWVVTRFEGALARRMDVFWNRDEAFAAARG